MPERIRRSWQFASPRFGAAHTATTGDNSDKANRPRIASDELQQLDFAAAIDAIVNATAAIAHAVDERDAVQTVAAKRRHVPRCQLGDHVERLRTVLDAGKLDLHWTSEHRPRVCLRPFERKDRAIAIREDQLLFWH